MYYIPPYYTHLFNCVTDAIKALQNQNYGEARDILIRAQQDAEEMYLEDGEEEDEEDDDAYEGGCYSWELDPILAEIERLEMQILMRECNEGMDEFVRHMREICPKNPECEKQETE